ncbi:hypothetical protein RclHR1_09390005 [Rhizophagus clarus]|uniref:Uncharacterized protein n=1 Tax=Rhizophagus clarus TaxID=94130 RepID=A0A2Z6SQL1_9GLOM|nr:hypothetical protein RclHR1_09390005 [Rhizophagus clarus]
MLKERIEKERNLSLFKHPFHKTKIKRMILKLAPVHQPKCIEKPRKHLKTWGARLRRRWFKVTGEECDLPLILKACQSLHHDLLQADDEAFEKIIPQEMGSSEVERQDTQEQDVIPKKFDHNIDTFVKDVADYSFLKELDMIEETETEELAGYFEGMKKIASIENHVPEGDIHFEEDPVGRDLERPHQNQSLMSKWEAKVPKRRKEQIKLAIAVKCIYYKNEKKGKSGKNFPHIKITEKWHRGEMRALLSENYIDEHLTSSSGEIDKKIEEYLENGSN